MAEFLFDEWRSKGQISQGHWRLPTESLSEQQVQEAKTLAVALSWQQLAAVGMCESTIDEIRKR